MSMTPPSRANTPEMSLEPGDRFEVARGDTGDQLSLPRVLGPGGFAVERLEDPSGRPLEMTLDPVHHHLHIPQLGRWIPAPGAQLWLEYQTPGSFRLAAEPVASAPAKIGRAHV